LTNGNLPHSSILTFGVRKAEAAAKRLVLVGLWDKTETGYCVHDYLAYQPSAEQVTTRRAAGAKRLAAWKVTHGHVGNNGDSNGVSNGVATLNPIPVPVPVPKVRTKNVPSADADFDAFRQAYPVSRRVGGEKAKSAFRRAFKASGENLTWMLAALEQHKASEQWQTPKLIPLMTTWLNGERWIQVLPEVPSNPLVGATWDSTWRDDCKAQGHEPKCGSKLEHQHRRRYGAGDYVHGLRRGGT
jgi:hypothetical protein